MLFDELVRMLSSDDVHLRGYSKIEITTPAKKATLKYIDVTRAISSLIGIPALEHLRWEIGFSYAVSSGIGKLKIITRKTTDDFAVTSLIADGVLQKTPCSKNVFVLNDAKKLPEVVKELDDPGLKVSTYHFPSASVVAVYKKYGLIGIGVDETGEALCEARKRVVLTKMPLEDVVKDISIDDEKIAKMVKEIAEDIGNADISLIVELLLYKDGNPWYFGNPKQVLYGAYLLIGKGVFVVPPAPPRKDSK